MILEALTYFLMAVMAVALLGMVVFGVLWAHQAVFAGLASEVEQDAAGASPSLGFIFVRRLGAVNRRFLWPGYESYLRRQLIRAGEPRAFAPEDILALQQGSFVVGGMVGVLVCIFTGFNILWPLLFAIFGAIYPLIWVNDQVKKRHLLITRALPYNLDLLTLSVEAGLDFTAALAKVVEKGKEGPLRDELRLVLKQLKMGKTREEALKAMIARVDLPSLTTFVTALVQADRMGTSLGKVLRIQSTQMRVERTQRAERLANEAPVKMLFPLIACIFPTVFMVLFGPIVFAWIYGNVGG